MTPTVALINQWALRAVEGDDNVDWEGYAVAFTGPDERDAFNQYFDANTMFGLEDLGDSILWGNFEHNRGDIRGVVALASAAAIEVRDDGLWMRGTLNEEHPAIDLVRAELRAGRLGLSLETLPNYLEVEDSGRVASFPVRGFALSMNASAPNGRTSVQYLRGLGLDQIDGDDDALVETSRTGVWFFSTLLQQSTDARSRAGGSARPVRYAQLPAGQRQAQRSLAFSERSRRPASGLPYGGRNSRVQVGDSEFDRHDLSDMLFFRYLRSITPGGDDREPLPRNFDNALLERFANELELDEQRPRNQREYSQSVEVPDRQRWQRAPGDRELFLTHFFGAQRAQHLRANEVVNTGAAGFGQEWIYTAWTTRVWRDIRQLAILGSLFPSFVMPAKTYNYPMIRTHPVIKTVSEATDQNQLDWANSPYPVTRPGTDDLPFHVVDGFGGAVILSDVQLRYSQIDNLGQFRMSLIEQMGRAFDEMLLHGDETASTSNISHFGTDPSATDYNNWLLVDGLRHFCVVGRTGPTMQGKTVNIGGKLFQLSDHTSMRRQMGVVGRDPRQLRLVVDTDLGFDFVDIPQFITVDDYGSNATVLNAEVGSFRGTPVLSTDLMEQANASGQLEDSHDTTLSHALLVHPDTVMVGRGLNVRMRSGYSDAGDAHYITAKAEFDVQCFQDEGVCYAYNIAGGNSGS